MGWSVEPVELASIKRRKQLPCFDFIEESIKGGRGYAISGGGYFIVANPVSLMPRFVVELVLPQIADIDQYKDLSFALNEHSCGMLWFDSSDFDSYEFAWRLRLGIRAGSPLFAWTKTSVALPKSDALSMRPAESEDLDFLAEMLDFPQHRGGKSDAKVVKQHLDKDRMLVLKNGSEPAGAALLVDQGSEYRSLTMALRGDSQGKGLGTYFAGQIGAMLAAEGKIMLAGTANDVPAALRGILSLRMDVVKHSFSAMIGSV